ncbi:hypothetical protein E5D57_006696 [Metarhizium anisopliae]|nr:hypothetical protein E5D57_006696 [Metarhizium anisopliae]
MTGVVTTVVRIPQPVWAHADSRALRANTPATYTRGTWLTPPKGRKQGHRDGAKSLLALRHPLPGTAEAEPGQPILSSVTVGRAAPMTSTRLIPPTWFVNCTSSCEEETLYLAWARLAFEHDQKDVLDASRSSALSGDGRSLFHNTSLPRPWGSR